MFHFDEKPNVDRQSRRSEHLLSQEPRPRDTEFTKRADGRTESKSTDTVLTVLSIIVESVLGLSFLYPSDKPPCLLVDLVFPSSSEVDRNLIHRGRIKLSGKDTRGTTGEKN